MKPVNRAVYLLAIGLHATTRQLLGSQRFSTVDEIQIVCAFEIHVAQCSCYTENYFINQL